jgi:hypothetical protein
MRDGLDEVRALLPNIRLKHLELLGGSERSTVRRVSADTRTLIVKTFPGFDQGWVRESAALSVMPVDAPAPRLVAAGDAPPIVVMSDVGTGTSVADALLGRDPSAATEAVVSWARAVASFHRATAGTRDAFRAALDARSGEVPVYESSVSTGLDKTARTIARYCSELDVDIPTGALDELRGLASWLDGDGTAALTPADACPDNNVRVGDALMLIDFEAAQWRHIAWDVAYLVVPWPSCWCSWRIPLDVAERAIAAYRAELALPYLDTADFRRDVAAAALGWAFVSTSWFLGRALTDDPSLSEHAESGPTRRAMIAHRLDEARRATELPALAELAGRLHEALARQWGDVPLAYAPAFGE